MKINRQYFLWFYFLFITLSTTTHSYAQDWPKALPEASAGTRWWWLGSAVDTANLRWNMEQYAKHGIGTVEITPLYGVQGNKKNNINFLSDKWMEMLRFTQSEGHRLGIEIDMATGTGWPFGGPWVPIEESASKMCFAEYRLEGKKLLGVSLSLTEKQQPHTQLLGVWAYDSRGTCVDLLPIVQQTSLGSIYLKGRLPRKAQWRIIALWQKMGVMKVKRAAPGGEGWVVDHFDKTAIEHYLAHIERAFERTQTPYPHTFFNDSYEVADADYTPQLFLEFQKRRGYSLTEHLGQLLDGDRTTVADYRETLSELLLENFTKTWTAWAHRHGAITRNQAHGSPANLLDCYSVVDIPEIEGFGLSDFGIKGLRKDPNMTRKNFSDLSMLKWASSAAHIMNKKFTSSETFTWLTEHFRTSLSQMKPDLDLMFCAGVNHMYFHGTCYSPKEAEWPGWKFYASIDMSPTNSIWRDAPYLMQYIKRTQSFLQWGMPDNDFLVYLPVRDIWNSRSCEKRLLQLSIHNMEALAPEFIKSVLTIDSLGYDCDYISERLLQKVKYVDGMLVTSAGIKYKGLIIPRENLLLTESVRNHINQLRQQGANIIIGSNNAVQMAQTARPEELKSKLGLRLIRRSNNTGYHYFIANLTPNDVDTLIHLAVDCQQAIWFNPMTGERYAAELNNGKVRINMLSGESMILQTFSHKTFKASERGIQLFDSTMIFPRKRVPFDKSSRTLEHGWHLTFIESTPTISDRFDIDSLCTWEKLNQSTRDLMGTGVYECTLNLHKEDLEGCNDWVINLGDVRESARVYINGHSIGCAWAVPYQLQFSGLLKAGKNTIRIEVTNLPANRIAALDRANTKWRKMEDINIVDINYKKTTYAHWTPVLSGLNSRVYLYRVK